MKIKKMNTNIAHGMERAFQTKAVKITQRVLILVVLLLIIWDIILYMANPNDTISSVIQLNAKKEFFVITWFWGVLAAHLFVARRQPFKKIPEPLAIIVLLLISFIIYISGMFLTFEIPQYFQLILLFTGGIAGYYLWPQTLDKSIP